MTYSRTTITPAPSPCTARPATKTTMSPATPAVSSPPAKAATPHGRATRTPRRSPTLPPTTMPTTEATRNALNGHAYQASPSRSATAVGIAVPTAIASKAMKVTSISSPAVVRRCARSKTDVLTVTFPPTVADRRPFPAADRGRATTRGVVGARRVWGAGCPLGSGSALAGGDLLGGGGDDGVQVTDHAEVGQLEGRRLRVLVDRDDRLRGLHPGPVLDGAGDAHRDVQLRRHRLAGLADLERVRVEAGVHRGARGTDRAAERVGQRLDDREVLRAGHTPSAGDDDRRLGQLGAAALMLHDPVDHAGLPGLLREGDLHRHLGGRGRRRHRGDGV